MDTILYNGIRLPDQWPPRTMDPQSTEPMPVPYLDHPPAVIPIDVGRQLLVDDFLIADTSLERIYHKPDRHPLNPVLTPRTPIETECKPSVGLQQGGAFYNPERDRYELFYHSGELGNRSLHFAISDDLLDWERPDLGSGDGNRYQMPSAGWTGHSIWRDAGAADPQARYKILTMMPKPRHVHSHCLHSSADGIHWGQGTPAGMAGDAQSLFFNPFRKVWVYSIKRSIERNGQKLRARWYAENTDFLSGADWSDAVYWTCTDGLDQPEPANGYPAHPDPGGPCQLYILHGSPYESIMLGMHEIHRGPENDVCMRGGFPKLTDLELGFSRDGFHWHRPDRSGFLRSMRQEGHWDRAYLHSTTSICLVHDDRLYFPYSGFSGVNPDGSQPGIYQGGAIGMATLRRDGFASMRATGTGGTLLTRPLAFTGEPTLYVNVANPGGALAVEVCSEDGRSLPGFAASDCQPISADATAMAVTWRGGRTLQAPGGRPIRLRFHLTRGDLYAFWVSSSPSGASLGYLGGGGRGFAQARDV